MRWQNTTSLSQPTMSSALGRRRKYKTRGWCYTTQTPKVITERTLSYIHPVFHQLHEYFNILTQGQSQGGSWLCTTDSSIGGGSIYHSLGRKTWPLRKVWKRWKPNIAARQECESAESRWIREGLWEGKQDLKQVLKDVTDDQGKRRSF